MKKIALFLLAAACLAGCDRTEGGLDPAQVKIDPIITRATEVNFEDGDRIGLTIIKEDQTVYAENSLLTFADGIFSGNLSWYPEANDKAAFVAYYPYSASGAPASFSVATDQQTTGYGASDLMGASKSGILPSGNSVGMIFKHMLTQIVFDVVNESGADITSVTLKGSIPTAKVDLEELGVTVDETAATADIVARQITANTTYRAIVVPQTVAFTLAVATSDGKTLTQALTSTTLQQGGQYTVNVRVIPDGLKVNLTGQIENWADKGEIGPDVPEVPFEEFEGYFMYDGKRYNTVTLANGTTWMATPLSYVPAGYTPSAKMADDSHIWYPYKLNMPEGHNSATVPDSSVEVLTDEASVAKNGYLYDFQAAFGVGEITADNYKNFEGAQGICPKGWHIPTRAEYFALCGNSSKAEGEGSAPTDKNALFYFTDYTSGKVGLFNDAGFNFVFSGARMQSNFAATPKYQPSVIYSGNCSVTEWHSLPSTNYYMTSTAYKTFSSGDALTNIQFFGLMTTFTSSYKEGKVSLSYVGIKTGVQIRCMKNVQ